MKRILSIASLFSFFSLAAQEGVVQGTLISSDRQPAGFIAVGVKGTTIGGNTNANGRFEIAGLADGTYTLVITQPGLRNIETVFVVAAGQPAFSQPILLRENAHHLQEVSINGVRNMNDRVISIGKGNIRPMDLPQSVAVIDREILEQQQTQNLGDALRNVNGVYIMGNTGGYQQELAARGFAMSSSNTFKNGVRFNNAVMPEMTAIERVEVMKGSTAILFGNVAPGGVINLVTKKPGFMQGGQAGFRAESFNYYEPFVDVQGVSENKKLGYRLNTSYETAGSFRQYVNSERVYLNPSMAVKLGARTDLVVEGDYLKDNRTADFGVGAIDYSLIDVPRERFIGVKWSRYNVEQKSITTTLNHRLNDNWQVRAVTAVQNFENGLFSNVRANSNNQFISKEGKWIRGLQRTEVAEEYYMAQLDLSGKFRTGVLGHQVLFGADADKYHTSTLAYNNINRYDSVNVFKPGLYKERQDIPEMTKRALTTAPIERAGVYFQDLVSLGLRWKLLAGARLSYLETGSRVTTYKPYKEETTVNYDFAVTPRFGLVYQPSEKVSFFSSYANSFNPNTGVDVNGKSLLPSFIDQYEAGIKSNLFRDVLSANLTVYQIVNSNLAQTSLANGNTNSNIKELAGEVTSKGVELDVMSKSLYGFVMVGGYSYNETRYTKSNTYVVGSLLRYNPMHTANLTLYYTVRNGAVKGLSFGSGFLYFGERQAGRSTRVSVENDTYRLIHLPAYNLIDLHAAYSWSSMSVRVKVSNVLNANGHNVHDDNSVNPIAPTQVAGTFAFRF